MQDDEYKRVIRAELGVIIEELDVLEREGGLDRQHVKKLVGKIRYHLSNYRKSHKGKPLPSIAEIFHKLCGSAPTNNDVIHFLKRKQPHAMKPDYGRIMLDRLDYLQRYEPPKKPPHKYYGPALGSGNYEQWLDEHGLNVLDSQRTDAIKFRKAFKKEHGRLPYRPEIRRSDPVC